MFGRFAELKDSIDEEIEKFRQKGAVTREKAMTANELGLSTQFKAFLRK